MRITRVLYRIRGVLVIGEEVPIGDKGMLARTGGNTMAKKKWLGTASKGKEARGGDP